MEVQAELPSKSNPVFKIESNESQKQLFSYKKENEDLLIKEEKSVLNIYDPFKKKIKKK